ncbi:MAG TPA: phosphate ABC transporter substrate-binding protein [Tepidisphaeraceae bacterium]|nr:phosphate ABC transporter substrate-binding protein [Tepidisphaeraceae bacterium]
MKWALTAVGLAVVIALLGVDWRGGNAVAVNVIGSTSIQPFAEMLAEEYNKHSVQFAVDVQGGGSTAGLQAAGNGMADIGMCSRSLKPEEAASFKDIVIARDGLAVVVHPGNPVFNLSTAQIHDMFAGKLTNWKEVGGKDLPIRLITREEGSGTREAFQKLVMGKARISRKALTQESNGSVKELVKHDPCAIGYMSLGLVGLDLKALQVDGVSATSDEVLAKHYPLVRPFLFVTKGEPNERSRSFIGYVMSPAGQKLLEKEGLVPMVKGTSKS